MVFVGIDPGLCGSCVVLQDDTSIEEILDFSKHKDDWPEQLQTLMSKQHRPSLHVYVEDVHAMPGQGVASVFTFGKNFGLILGVLRGLGISYQLLRPRLWQELAWDSGPEDQWAHAYRHKPKMRSFKSACLYWGEDKFISERKAKKSGPIDAALIARAGWSLLQLQEKSKIDEIYLEINEEKRIKRASVVKDSRIKQRQREKEKRNARYDDLNAEIDKLIS